MFKPQDAEARTIKPDRITNIDHDGLGEDGENTSIIECAEHKLLVNGIYKKWRIEEPKSTVKNNAGTMMARRRLRQTT